MNPRYIVKCFNCLKFYEDANYLDAYKDSLMKQFISNQTGRVIKCCPYCDEIFITMVSVPKYKPETYLAYR